MFKEFVTDGAKFRRRLLPDSEVGGTAAPLLSSAVVTLLELMFLFLIGWSETEAARRESERVSEDTFLGAPSDDDWGGSVGLLGRRSLPGTASLIEGVSGQIQGFDRLALRKRSNI